LLVNIGFSWSILAGETRFKYSRETNSPGVATPDPWMILQVQLRRNLIGHSDFAWVDGHTVRSLRVARACELVLRSPNPFKHEIETACIYSTTINT
jgi:hypothetical protein